jgi:RNA-binding protein
MSLSGKQRHHLRGLGHALSPIAHIGKDGLSDAFVAAVDQALTDHELIKVKILDTADLDRHEAADALAERTGSEVAQVLGHTVLLFRAHPEDPTISLP